MNLIVQTRKNREFHWSTVEKVQILSVRHEKIMSLMIDLWKIEKFVGCAWKYCTFFKSHIEKLQIMLIRLGKKCELRSSDVENCEFYRWSSEELQNSSIRLQKLLILSTKLKKTLKVNSQSLSIRCKKRNHKFCWWCAEKIENFIDRLQNKPHFWQFITRKKKSQVSSICRMKKKMQFSSACLRNKFCWSWGQKIAFFYNLG